jgi:hypothetical protein
MALRSRARLWSVRAAALQLHWRFFDGGVTAGAVAASRTAAAQSERWLSSWGMRAELQQPSKRITGWVITPWP